MTSQAEAAAEEYVNKEICYGGLEYALSGKTAEECTKSFLAGRLWTLKHDPLVSALADCIAYILENDANSPERGRMKDALQKFREGVGE